MHSASVHLSSLSKFLESLFFFQSMSCKYVTIDVFFNTMVCRFAILSGPTIPIIGEGDEEANDRYICYLWSIPFPSSVLDNFELCHCNIVYLLFQYCKLM